MDYDILFATDVMRLIEITRQALSDGWEPIGGMTTEKYSGVGVTFYQAVSKGQHEILAEKPKRGTVEGSLLHHLRHGNFTLYYHNQGDCTVYLGIWTQEEIENTDDSDLIILQEMGSPDLEGYLPGIVEALTKALGGRAHTA